MLVLSSFTYFESKLKKKDTPLEITARLEQIAGDLHAPTAIVFPKHEEVWITEQTGKIRVIRNGKMVKEPLLDLSDKLVKLSNSYDERGLLGIALHPNFITNKKFYVFYSAPSRQKSDHTGIVAEYALSTPGPIDSNSGRIILAIEEPEPNHNGGCIHFGPDGFLYVSSGDGGGQGDKHGEQGNGQNMDTWLGKILRIDVNSKTGYRIPEDNPFIGRAHVKPEIWAYGFRNPYRFSFDKVSKQLFTGEVGQDLWEEVDIVKKGANYGWRLMEGAHCYNPRECDNKGITMPIHEYDHKLGVSIIGGYVYNGKHVPVLAKKYIFADWTGKVFYLQKAGDTWERGNVTLVNFPLYSKITGFGEDQESELYLIISPDTGPSNLKGIVYKIVKK